MNKEEAGKPYSINYNKKKDRPAPRKKSKTSRSRRALNLYYTNCCGHSKPPTKRGRPIPRKGKSLRLGVPGFARPFRSALG